MRFHLHTEPRSQLKDSFEIEGTKSSILVLCQLVSISTCGDQIRMLPKQQVNISHSTHIGACSYLSSNISTEVFEKISPPDLPWLRWQPQPTFGEIIWSETWNCQCWIIKKKVQPFSIASLWSVGFWAVSCEVVESRFWAPVQRQSPLVPSKLPPSPDSPWPALLWEYDWENGVWPRFGLFIPGHLAYHQLDFVFNIGRSSAWTISEIYLKDTS